jgi:hypothetical protein
MTIINTDAPGVSVDVSETVNYGPTRPSQVRFQAWAEGDDEHPYTHLVDLRFTPEQAVEVADALYESSSVADHSNL